MFKVIIRQPHAAFKPNLLPAPDLPTPETLGESVTAATNPSLLVAPVRFVAQTQLVRSIAEEHTGQRPHLLTAEASVSLPRWF